MAVATHCGIAPNLGKTRVIAASPGPDPPGIAELGDDVWRGDKPPAQQGVVILGSLIGHPEFVHAWADERIRAEGALLDHLPQLPDLQCACLQACLGRIDDEDAGQARPIPLMEEILHRLLHMSMTPHPFLMLTMLPAAPDGQRIWFGIPARHPRG